MDKSLVCDEITQSVLNMSWYVSQTLAGVFQFQRYERKFSNTEPLRDCHIYQIRPVERFGSLPGQPGMPDPAIFLEHFPELLNSFIERDSSLYLHIKSIDPEFFDELSVLTQTIRPLGAEYMLLSPVARNRAPHDFGNLIFECPAGLIPEITRNWFYSPFIEIEGYVMGKGEFGRLADSYFLPDSVETIRRILSVMRVGLRLWPDFNGIYVFSDRSWERVLACVEPRHDAGL